MASDITQSTLNLTTDEKRTYGQLFQQADTDKLGVVTGDVAVKFFERTKLDPPILAEIWQIADTENRGLLTPAGFSVALRLIGHCQGGREPSLELAKQPGPLPRFDDAAAPSSHTQSVGPPSSPPPIAAQTSGPIRVPPLTPDKVNEYSSLFDKAGARNGFLGGDAAKQVFERARLPNETLGRIWNLADTEQRGALSSTEFVIAMHLIASMKTGVLRTLPQTLPPGLYDAAGRRGPPPPAPASRQLSSPVPQRTQSPTIRPPMAPQTMSPQSTGDGWIVTPQDKAKFDQIFASIDKSRSGYINGEQAVQFFSTSGLSEDILASIWDLADINSEGQLSRDEFAVAMYLIRQQRGKREDRGNLPTSLPPNLVPPSMRQRTLPPSQPTAPAFDNAAFAPQQPKSAADDLFGLDAMSASDTASQQAPASPASPQRTGTTGAYQPPSLASNTAFKPFMPISSFGQGLASQNTGSSGQTSQPQTRDFQQSQSGGGGDDLLGDNDPEVSNKITDETMELGNMSNQIGQLRTQMQETQTKKSSIEGEVTATTNQKRELETRLQQFRTQYEQEIREVKVLEERLNASRAETRKVQQELAMVEGAYQDLQTQHQQVATALEADQRENASLKERLQQVNTEVSQLRPQLEKMRSDARQQRGMVAINKKQLTTSEAEGEKLRSEMDELQGAAEQDRSIVSPSEPQPTDSGVVSPAPSTASQSTNPFFRKPADTGTTSPSMFEQSASPSQDQNAFDSFFQTTGSPAPSAGPPPATTFRSVTPTSHSSTPPASTPSGSTVDASPATEPPAPPESRQMTSSSLPLRPSNLRTESVSSSVKANPPASRAGESTSATPTRYSGTPAGSVDGDGSVDLPMATDAQSRAIPSVPTVVDQADSSEQSQSTDHDLKPEEAVDAVPGAFPDVTTPVTPQPSASVDTQSSETTREIGTTSEDPEDTPTNLDRAPSTSAPFPADTTNRSAPEFPPIQELEQDSDSSSDEEAGFGDDFTASSNTATVPASSTTNQSAVSTTEDTKPPSSILLPPARNGNEQDTSELPTPTAQKSPPTYEQSMPLTGEPRGSNQFPPEFEGLLPSREMPDSPPQDVPQNRSESTTAVAPDSSITNGHVAPTPSTTDDDFDSAFGDLSDAKDADEMGGQDSFAFDSTQPDSYEFDPTFESPAPQSTAASASVAQSETPSKAPSLPPRSQTTDDSFANFQPSFGSTSSPFDTSSSTVPTSSTTADSSSHDWDEIFAGLDSNDTSTSTNDPFALQGSSSTAQPSSVTAPLNRAMSSSTEHDDPILKTLTGMGYDREEAVKALEKYDYNLDMAADYLTSRH